MFEGLVVPVRPGHCGAPRRAGRETRLQEAGRQPVRRTQTLGRQTTDLNVATTKTWGISVVRGIRQASKCVSCYRR